MHTNDHISHSEVDIQTASRYKQTGRNNLPFRWIDPSLLFSDVWPKLHQSKASAFVIIWLDTVTVHARLVGHIQNVLARINRTRLKLCSSEGVEQEIDEAARDETVNVLQSVEMDLYECSREMIE